MADETTSAAEQGTATPTEPIPTDFKEFVNWRQTGELSANEGEKPAVPATAQESEPNGEPQTQVKTAPDSEPEDSSDTPAPAAGEEKRPGARERKIDRLVRENSELLRRIEALERPGPAAAVSQPSQPPPIPAASKPDLNDFNTLEEYTEALTDWKLDQREAKRKAEDQRRAEEAAAKTLQDSWNAKEKAAMKAHPDYTDLRDSTPIPDGPGVMAIRQAMLEDDNGAELLYWLASRPAELKRIAALNPAKAVLEVGKVAAALASPVSEPQKPKVSNAPKPPSPISHGTIRTADNVNDEDTARDFKRWKKAREAQLKG